MDVLMESTSTINKIAEKCCVCGGQMLSFNQTIACQICGLTGNANQINIDNFIEREMPHIAGFDSIRKKN